MTLSSGNLLGAAGDAREKVNVTAANFDAALTEAKRKLAVSFGYDATENLAAAHGTGIDDFPMAGAG